MSETLLELLKENHPLNRILKSQEEFEKEIETFFSENTSEFIIENILVETEGGMTITPLMIACQIGQPLVVDKIIQFLRDYYEEQKEEDVSPKLKEYINKKNGEKTSETALHYCFLEGFVFRVSYGRHNGRLRPEEYSAKRTLECVKLLLDYGADCNVTNLFQETPLILLYKKIFDEYRLEMDATDFPLIVQYLLRFGSDVNVQDDTGKTALMYAVTMVNQFHNRNQVLNYEMILSKLLNDECKADVNLQDEKGYTALMYCFENLGMEDPDFGMIKCLLEKGSNPNVEGKNRKTPLTLAIEYENTDIITELLKYGADVNQIMSKDLEYIKNKKLVKLIDNKKIELKKQMRDVLIKNTEVPYDVADQILGYYNFKAKNKNKPKK